MKKQYLIILFFFAGSVLSCAYPRAAYKAGFDFSRIRSVRVGEFSSSANQPNSGAAVANEFIRQLLSRGYTVTTGDAGDADVVLSGNVTEFQPNRRYLIKTDQAPGTTQQVIVVQPPVELGGSNTYNLGSAFGLGADNKIVVSNATVGVSAFLKDRRTGEIIWSNAYTYEGLDLNTAMDGVVRFLLHSLPSEK